MNIKNILGTLAFVTLTTNAFASDSLNPHIEFGEVVANGNACPGAEVEARQIGNSVFLNLPMIVSELVAGDRFERDVCQATIEILKPAGLSYRVKKVSYGAWAGVKGTATASLGTSVYEQGSIQTESQDIELNKFWGDLKVGHDLNLEVGCDEDRALNLKTTIDLRNQAEGSGKAYVKQQGGVSIELEWFECE